MRPPSHLAVLTAFLLVLTSLHAADTVEYNRDILPILAENCFTCHGPDKATRQAKLRLDNFADATSETEHPAAIVPRDSARSELLLRVKSADLELCMPPRESGKRLTARQIELLQLWIQNGADYQPHWSLVPPKPQRDLLDAASGEVATTSPIDLFVLKAMPGELGGFNPPADRLTLVRRMYLDLTGLPPSRSELDSIANDGRFDDIERTIDRILASPRFGERWSRWWLDLAHYADSDGYLQDFLRPHAWRYRAWVVDAFNNDMPFDQFTLAQLAGDLMAEGAGDPSAQQLRIATGFLRNTLSNREGGADLEEYRVRQVVDRTVTVSTTWLGLTVACAECHDHKYDPLTQVDFYRLYAFFNDCDEVNIDAPLPDEQQLHNEAWPRYLSAREQIIDNKAIEIQRLQTEWEEKLLWTEQHPGADHRWDRLLEVLGLVWGQGNGEGQLEGLNIIKTMPQERTAAEHARLQDYFLQHGSLIDPPAFTKLELESLSTRLSALTAELPKISRPQTISTARRSRATRVHTRGDFRQPGQVVEPGIPQVLLAHNATQPRDRYELGLWLISSENPLTARVVVNRVWQELFGRGLVSTSENLGVRGAAPSNPELLDWLARELVRQQWSLKQLIRHIVTTQVYQQSSHVLAHKQQLDPANVWLARSPRLRLSAEAVRDSILSSSGLLDARMGGPSVRPPQPASVASEGFDNKWEVSPGGDRYRRGLYTFWQRTSPFAQSVNFDMPDSSRSCTRRERSNTPLQALALMNDPVLLEGAVMAAYQALHSNVNSTDQRLDVLYWTLLGRLPSNPQRQRLLDFLQVQLDRFAKHPQQAIDLVSHRPEQVATDADADAATWAAWTMVASVLLNLDEAINKP